MIYLDHAAATPVSPKVLEAMLPYFSEDFFNPSAPYLPAKRVREAYVAAKDQIAQAIGAKGADLVITAGATESINLAFTVLASSSVSPQKALVLATEHAAVLEAARSYPHESIAVDPTGLIDLADLRAKLHDDVALVSVSLANNELGTIQPLAEIAELLRAVRQDRLARGCQTPLYFHSDASQAANLLDLGVSRLGVDLLTLNAAKCGGPKGVGALYLAHGVPVRPLTRGGGQERGLRSGTENVPGVIGFAAALTAAKQHLAGNRKRYAALTARLKSEILARIDVAIQDEPAVAACAPLFLGHPKRQLANFLPLSFPGVDAERLVYKLEQQGILVATGAACAANKGTKSHVLAALGLPDEVIAGSLRLSLGSTNTLEQMPLVADALVTAVVAEFRRIHHE